LRETVSPKAAITHAISQCLARMFHLSIFLLAPGLVGSPAPIRHAIILFAPEWRAMIFLPERAYTSVKAVIAMKRRQNTRRVVKCRIRKSRSGEMRNGFFKKLLNRDAGDLEDLSVDVADLTGCRCQAGTSISLKAPRNQWQRFSQ